MAATDEGTGVQRILYSVDGTNYQPYTAPLNLNPSLTSTVYAFADDNVANRSGVVSYQLTPGALRLDGVAPAAGRASGGQQVKLTGAFANLSAVTLGGVSASWSYTNGTGEVTVITPPQAPGVVGITLTTTAGDVLAKPNGFAYLSTVFTDDPLVARVTTSKGQHVIELRQAVDALRAVAGLAPAPWTDPTLSPFSTIIRADHIKDLRRYLEEAATGLGYPAVSYTDPSLDAGSVIKLAHIEELRRRIRDIAH